MSTVNDPVYVEIFYIIYIIIIIIFFFVTML